MDFLRHMTLVLATALAVALSACSRPDQTESFVRSSQKTAAGFYEFMVDMSDKEASYDIQVYTRSDCRDKVFAALPDLGIGIVWTAPDGTEYREMVYIPHEDFDLDSSFSHSVRVAYRTGLVPVQPGVWKMSMVVPEEERFHLRGMGIVVHADRTIIDR